MSQNSDETLKLVRVRPGQGLQKDKQATPTVETVESSAQASSPVATPTAAQTTDEEKRNFIYDPPVAPDPDAVDVRAPNIPETPFPLELEAASVKGEVEIVPIAQARFEPIGAKIEIAQTAPTPTAFEKLFSLTPETASEEATSVEAEVRVNPSLPGQPGGAEVPAAIPAWPEAPSSITTATPFSDNSDPFVSPTERGMRRRTIIKDARLRSRVQHYADWLEKQAEYDAQRDRSEELKNYVKEATKVVKVKGAEVSVFAPFRPKFSALQTFTRGQVLTLAVIILLCLVGVAFFRWEMLTAALALATLVYAFYLLLNIILVARAFRSPLEEHIDAEVVHALKGVEWPMYTILCPLYEETQVVPQFAQAMEALDYPVDKLQILLLTEESDRETRNAIRALALPPQFRTLVVPDGQPRTKPRACNYGLLYAEGSYVVIYDAEDVPDPHQLKKAVLTFANHGVHVACVQAKLNFYNARQNLLTRWFTAEYLARFDLILPGLQLARSILPLGGSSNHFRVDHLRALGAWDAYNVTEDCDLGVRLKRYKLETVMLDSTTLEEANPQLKNWIRQRSRWIKGYMQTYLVHMRDPRTYLRKGHFSELFSFQFVVGTGTGMMMLNPLLWVLFAAYLVFGSSVLNLYHILFPGPMLYLSAFCLLFGNFFSLYLYLLACARKKEYDLLPWMLLAPLYWVLMSVAAFFAFYELLVRPHYWQKTIHGLHLKGQIPTSQTVRSRIEMAALIEEPTLSVPIVFGAPSTEDVLSVTSSLRAIPTQMLPAISLQQKKAQKVARHAKVRDLWLVATICIACVASIASCWYYFDHHDILLYADALSHLRISRSVFDNSSPGLAQLGSIWLPLPHILMWPFIWNDYLWRTGLAGSFVAMTCYVVASIYIFLAARKLTHNSCAAFIGSLAFVLNPNVLYLQSTPLSETVIMATFTMSCYYFLCWIEKGRTRYIVVTAICTFLATLAHYNNWPVLVAIMVFIPLVGILKRQRATHIVSNFIIYTMLGGLGIVLWLLWNQLIFGNPLYFQNSIYSSQDQQMQQLQVDRLFAYQNLGAAIRDYLVDTLQSAGTALCLLAVIGLVWFLIRRRFKAETLGLLVFLVPFAFYVLSLYTGQAIIWLPGATSANLPLYNVRYGAQMVAGVAVLIAVLAASIRVPSHKNLTAFARFMLVGVILFQSFLTVSQGIVALKEGQYDYACITQTAVANYLAQHYQSGYILEDVASTQSETDPTLIGIDFSNFIYEGSDQLWQQALQSPAAVVNWIIVNPTNRQDLVAQHFQLDSPAFLSTFKLVATQADGMQLYARIGQPSGPLHPGLQLWSVPHTTCS